MYIVYYVFLFVQFVVRLLHFNRNSRQNEKYKNKPLNYADIYVFRQRQKAFRYHRHQHQMKFMLFFGLIKSISTKKKRNAKICWYIFRQITIIITIEQKVPAVQSYLKSFILFTRGNVKKKKFHSLEYKTISVYFIFPFSHLYLPQ